MSHVSCTGEYGRLIGTGGKTLQEIQKSSACHLRIPRGPEDGPHVVLQGTPKAIEAAKQRIEEILKHTVWK